MSADLSFALVVSFLTRASAIELARDQLGLAVHETEVSPEDPLTADETFLTGTAAEIDPVAVFDSSSVGEEVQVTSPDRSLESSPKLRRAS